MIDSGLFTIAKDVTFSASHVLEGLPEGHQCGRLHGHNYRVTVELRSVVLDEAGMVVDYGALDGLFGAIRGTFDHRHLNEEMSINPTAENLALVIWRMAAAAMRTINDDVLVSAVRVYETDRTMAEYRP